MWIEPNSILSWIWYIIAAFFFMIVSFVIGIVIMIKIFKKDIDEGMKNKKEKEVV